MKDVIHIQLLFQRFMHIVALISESQPGFRNWVHQVGNCKILGGPIFQGPPQCNQITTINMIFLIEIKHIILIKCHVMSMSFYVY